MQRANAAPHGLSERLHAAAAALGDERVSLQALLAAHGPAAPGALLVLVSAACMVPLPGVGMVLGLGLLSLAWALARGQHLQQLPERVAAWCLPASAARRMLASLARFHGWAERVARLRWPALAQPSLWLAAKTALMAVWIILPIPLGNVLPGLALVLLGLGLAHRDGLVVLAAWGMAAAATAYVAALGWSAWAVGGWLA